MGRGPGRRRRGRAALAALVSPVQRELRRILDAWLARVREDTGGLPVQEYDPAWPSPCQLGPPDAAGLIRWQPVAREREADFSGLAQALEVPIHTDFRAYYGSYWCDSFEVQAADGGLTLLQVWNQDDFERLIGNLLGHALAKRNARQPLTLFFACTDEDDLFLSLENHSGRILLERPGQPPLRAMAPDLASFLSQLRA